jgi:hypothetical protein
MDHNVTGQPNCHTFTSKSVLYDEDIKGENRLEKIDRFVQLGVLLAVLA